MSPEQFVKLAKAERDEFLAMCFDSDSTEVSAEVRIAAINRRSISNAPRSN